MRIAHVICVFPPYKGGMGNIAFNIAREQGALGHEVTVLTPRYSNAEETSPEDYPGFTVKWLRPVAQYGNSAIMPQVLPLLRGHDVVHLHYPFYGTAGFVAANRLLRRSQPFVVQYHMDNKDTGLRGVIFEAYRRLILPVVLRLADLVVCSSFDYISHSEAAGYYRRHPDRFVEIPYGVDSEFFSPRAGLGRDGGKTVLFVGALSSQGYFKGVENLLRAFVEVSSSVEGARLMIVGRGDLEGYYHELATRLGLDGFVEFIHDADDRRLVECYRSCYVTVLPSTDSSESFGLVLIEAMACGRPVMASDLAGVRSTFVDGEQGLLVKPGDIDDLGRKLVSLLNDSEKADEMGASGRSRVTSGYRWEAAAERLVEAYGLGREAGTSGDYDEAYFEGGSLSGDSSPVKQKIIDGYLAAVKEAGLLKEGTRALDIGCAFGYFMSLLVKEGLAPVGIDISSYAVEKASRVDGAAASVCDANEDLPFAEGSFDVVTMFDVVEHLRSPYESFVEVRRVLDRGGYLIVTTPNTFSLERMLMKEKWSGAADPTHLSLFDRYSLGFVLEKAAFEVVRAATAFPTMPPAASRLMGRTGLGGQLFFIARAT